MYTIKYQFTGEDGILREIKDNGVYQWQWIVDDKIENLVWKSSTNDGREFCEPNTRVWFTDTGCDFYLRGTLHRLSNHI